MPFHHDHAKKCGKQKRKIDVDEEGIPTEECEKAERRRRKRLRKEAERRIHQGAKDKAKDQKDEDIGNSNPVDESLDQGSGGETQHLRKEKKKNKRLKPTPVDDKLNRHTPMGTDKRTLEGDDCAKRSRKRRRRDSGL